MFPKCFCIGALKAGDQSVSPPDKGCRSAQAGVPWTGIEPRSSPPHTPDPSFRPRDTPVHIDFHSVKDLLGPDRPSEETEAGYVSSFEDHAEQWEVLRVHSDLIRICLSF